MDRRWKRAQILAHLDNSFNSDELYKGPDQPSSGVGSGRASDGEGITVQAGSDRPVQVNDEGETYVPPVLRVMGTVEETLGKTAGIGDESFSGALGDTITL